jgi:large subunit ribosomal protein L16
MALMPSRVRWRKVQRGTLRGVAQRGNEVSFGEWGLQALEWAWLDGRQIEAGRVAASRAAPEARIFIRIFPHKPVSKKPLETRMGKGKGEPDKWVAEVKPGHVIYEIAGVTEEKAVLAFNRVAHKLPINTRLIRRRHGL